VFVNSTDGRRDPGDGAKHSGTVAIWTTLSDRHLTRFAPRQRRTRPDLVGDGTERIMP